LSSNAENSFVSNFRIADHFVKLRVSIISGVWRALNRLQEQHGILLLLISNEMNSDANTSAHLSAGPKVNGQQNLAGFF